MDEHGAADDYYCAAVWEERMLDGLGCFGGMEEGIYTAIILSQVFAGGILASGLGGGLT